VRVEVEQLQPGPGGEGGDQLDAHLQAVTEACREAQPVGGSRAELEVRPRGVGGQGRPLLEAVVGRERILRAAPASQAQVEGVGSLGTPESAHGHEQRRPLARRVADLLRRAQGAGRGELLTAQIEQGQVEVGGLAPEAQGRVQALTVGDVHAVEVDVTGAEHERGVALGEEQHGVGGAVVLFQRVVVAARRSTVASVLLAELFGTARVLVAAGGTRAAAARTHLVLAALLVAPARWLFDADAWCPAAVVGQGAALAMAAVAVLPAAGHAAADGGGALTG